MLQPASLFGSRLRCVRFPEQEIFLNPDTEAITRTNAQRGLDVEISSRHFRSQRPDLLADNLSDPLGLARIGQDRRVLALTNADTGSKRGGQ